ncbi:MAG: potassium transporter Kup [Acidimicrobiia bacterium]|nr:potassium transporter Kup [Acidimicrobiia bacterium]
MTRRSRRAERSSEHAIPHTGGTAALAFGTLGIVYGDIGTSPIYALRESFEHAELRVDETSTYGAASVVFWALLLIISLKYLLLVMRADNHGEGGILALTSLLMPTREMPQGRTRAIIVLGVFGTALLYGDGLITPAISVLSAVEGFEVATSAFEDWVIPVSIAILVALFLVQKRGTELISRVFSPVMVVWFLVLGVLGVRQIIEEPGVLRAINPAYGVDLFFDQPLRAFIALGSIFLVVTGGEALYADMGHFGRRPIQLSWYSLVLPALVLNYFGQAALLTRMPEAVESPFYMLAPEWAITPLAILATMATVIASQALISGAFSLTAQAVQLDYLPRLDIRHTSSSHVGQIYVPLVNWLLMLGCVGLVIGFRSSANLAAAYGIAVTTTMAITTLLFYRVVVDRWGWSKVTAALVVFPLFLVDLAFFSANVAKIPHGGWFPLLVGFGLVVQMTTWRRGRSIVAGILRRGQRPIEEVTAEVVAEGVARVPGTAIYMFKDPGFAPPAMISNLRHNHVLHRLTVVLSVVTDGSPRVQPEQRVTATAVSDGVFQVVLTFGFMEEPDVLGELRDVKLGGVPVDPDTATFFIGRETVTSTPAHTMPVWREQLFVLLNRGAASASRFYNLPSKQVFEVGTQVDI